MCSGNNGDDGGRPVLTVVAVTRGGTTRPTTRREGLEVPMGVWNAVEAGADDDATNSAHAAVRFSDEEDGMVAVSLPILWRKARAESNRRARSAARRPSAEEMSWKLDVKFKDGRDQPS